MRRTAVGRRAALGLLAAALAVVGLAPVASAGLVEVVRVAGSSRVGTAAHIAGVSHPDGAETVVVARADAYADALAGGPLAATLDAPVLLTGSQGLDPVAAAEVGRLGASRAVLLGGTGALAPAVEDGLRAAGVADVQRIAGSNRFATAAAIATRMAAEGVPTTAAYLAEGANADPARGWPDALAVSPLAAFERRPVLLATAGDLPADTAAALTELGVTELTVVGGPVAVGPAVEARPPTWSRRSTGSRAPPATTPRPPCSTAPRPRAWASPRPGLPPAPPGRTPWSPVPPRPATVS